MEKKKKKAKSKTAIIKNLREERDRYYRILKQRYNEICFRDIEIEKMKRILPVKFYKITFTVNDKLGSPRRSTQLVSSYNAEMAIDGLKKALSDPETFELIDIECRV
jgi:hypothetical protein